MTPLIAGNWKMNGLAAARVEVDRLVEALNGGHQAAARDDIDVLVCPPATLLAPFAAEFAEKGVLWGGQDCHGSASGAHTGDISAEMLADAGAGFVIVGHSERRAEHGEGDNVVKAKAEAALRAGLTPIVCVGETKDQREAGDAERVVGGQLAGSMPAPETVGDREIVIAYEPVWAIGTGLTPTLDDIASMHSFIRGAVGPTRRILYGGSVKPTNAKDILRVDHVGGALVGGASLKADDFIEIIAAA